MKQLLSLLLVLLAFVATGCDSMGSDGGDGNAEDHDHRGGQSDGTRMPWTGIDGHDVSSFPSECPIAEQQEEVRDPDVAVVVEIGRARLWRNAARTPCRE